MKRTLLVSAAAAALFAAPLQAQRYNGIFTQAYQRDPFALLLHGRHVFSASGSLEVGNNTLNLGDIVAIREIQEADDFQPSDVFLIGGLVPEGEGLRFATRDNASLAFALPAFGGVWGISVGARTYAEGTLPDDIAALARDGFSGDRLVIDFTDSHSRLLAFGDVALTGLYAMPLADERFGLRLGAGVHYLYGLNSSGVTFGTGGRGGSVAISADGVDADLLVSTPSEFESGGTGFALDLFAGLNYRTGAFVTAQVSSIGKLSASTGTTEERRLQVSGATLGEFMDSLDAMTTTSLPGTTETVSLPYELRLTGSYEVHPMLGVGVAYQRMLGGDFNVSPPISGLTGIAELRLIESLPLRLGLNTGGQFGAGPIFGAGVHLGPLRLDLEANTRGGFAIDEWKTGSVRMQAALHF